MKILITGASGFLGGHLVRKAVESNFETFAGVRATSNVSQFKDLTSVTFVDLPYINKEKLKSYLLECKNQWGTFDYIIHNAGITKCKHESDFDSVNFENTRNFVEALIETDAVPRKFIYISSLGAVGPGNDKTLEPLTLTDIPKPNTLYGVSKLKSEEFLQSTIDFPYLVVRPTGIYGPEDKEYNIYVSTINKGFEPYLGFKPQYLSFIYVTDLVNVIFSMLEGNITRKAYFVSDGQTYTQQEYAQLIKKYLHRKTLKITLPLSIIKALFYGFDVIGGCVGKVPTLNADKYKIMSARNWVCDISELKKDFNYTPHYLLEDGVRETVDWFLKQKKSSKKK